MRRAARSWSSGCSTRSRRAGPSPPARSSTTPGATGPLGLELVGVKQALEWLFYAGEVTAAGRTTSFDRVYDLPERVLPRAVLDAPTPTARTRSRSWSDRRPGARRRRPSGDLRDYFRLPVADATARGRRARRGRRAAAGRGRGLDASPAYLHAEARLPRPVRRARAAQPVRPADVGPRPGRAAVRLPLPDRDLRAGAASGVYGYYVLPFLLGDRLAARVDLKADRKAGVLRVPAAWVEPAAAAGRRPPRRSPRSCVGSPAGWASPRVAPPERGDFAGRGGRRAAGAEEAVFPSAVRSDADGPPPRVPIRLARRGTVRQIRCLVWGRDDGRGGFDGGAARPVDPFRRPRSARAPRWLAPLAVLGCAAGAVGYTLVTDPTDARPEAVPSCLLKLTTGFDCPGCGGTRALWYVLHGDLPAAARHHLLFVFALPFVIYLYVAWAGQRVFGWRVPQLRISPADDRRLPHGLAGLHGGAQPAVGAVYRAVRVTGADA